MAAIGRRPIGLQPARAVAPALPAPAQAAPRHGLPEVDASELKFVRSLASGGQKRVGLYHWTTRGIDVVKCSLLEGDTDSPNPALHRLHQEFMAEIALLADLGAHRHIMRVLATVRGQVAFLAEHCIHGSLASRLRDGGLVGADAALSVRLDLPARVRIARGVARAVAFLHALPLPLIHGDLSSANVLLDAALAPKLCDFGLSRTQTKTMGVSKAAGGERGTIFSMAPEQLEKEQHHVTYKADVWAIGCLLIELFHPRHEMPYSNFHHRSVGFQIVSGKHPPELSEVQPLSLRDFIGRRLLVADPRGRADLDEVLTALYTAFPLAQYPDAEDAEPDRLTIDQLRARPPLPLPGQQPVPAQPPQQQQQQQRPVHVDERKIESPPRIAAIGSKVAKQPSPPRLPALAQPQPHKEPPAPQPQPAAAPVRPKPPRPLSAAQPRAAAVAAGAKASQVVSGPKIPAAVKVAGPLPRLLDLSAAATSPSSSQAVSARLAVTSSLLSSRPAAVSAGPARPASAVRIQDSKSAVAAVGPKKRHTGFWRFPPVGHIKGEWSCCGSTSYHDQFCVR